MPRAAAMAVSLSPDASAVPTTESSAPSAIGAVAVAAIRDPLVDERSPRQLHTLQEFPSVELEHGRRVGVGVLELLGVDPYVPVQRDGVTVGGHATGQSLAQLRQDQP